MRTAPDATFPTVDDAVAWMDAPGRVPLVWGDEHAVRLIDGLLEPHGLEVVVTEFQGDPYATIEAREIQCP